MNDGYIRFQSKIDYHRCGAVRDNIVTLLILLYDVVDIH